jgi:hypothetical protein
MVKPLMTVIGAAVTGGVTFCHKEAMPRKFWRKEGCLVAILVLFLCSLS